MSAEGKARIAEATRKRWAEYNAQRAVRQINLATVKPGQGRANRKMSKSTEAPAFTKSLLVESVRNAVDLSPEQASGVVEAVFDAMIDELHRGGKVEVRHFGSFRRRTRSARQGRNPLTGVAVEVPAKVVVHFTPSQALRRVVNGTG